jgi:hypothetical protein
MTFRRFELSHHHEASGRAKCNVCMGAIPKGQRFCIIKTNIGMPAHYHAASRYHRLCLAKALGLDKV